MQRLLAVAGVLFVSQSALAQDHLEPEDSIYQGRATQDDILSGYDRDVVRKFSEFYDWKFSTRAIVLPSFQTEFAIGISSDNESPRIVGLRAETQLWLYSVLKSYERGEIRSTDLDGNDSTRKREDELRASLPPSIDDVVLTRCEMPITDDDRSLYVSLWRRMLFEARYPNKPRPGFDGVIFHFSGDFEYQSLAGKTWSPKDGSRTQRLTKIAETLFQACSENSSVKFMAARQQADTLCAEIACSAK